MGKRQKTQKCKKAKKQKNELSIEGFYQAIKMLWFIVPLISQLLLPEPYLYHTDTAVETIIVHSHSWSCVDHTAGTV